MNDANIINAVHSLISMVTFAFATFGLAFILGHAMITEWVRDRLEDFSDVRDCGGGFSDHSACCGLPTTRVSRVLGPFRFLARWTLKLITCPGCCGFWMGLLYGHWRAGTWGAPTIALALAACGWNTYAALRCGLIRRD